MTLRTLPLYLLGHRPSILALASSRWTLPTGALFVLSAGLAREYDGESLLHESWYLAIPFGASIAASLLMFVVFHLIALLRRAGSPGFLRAYGVFLGLFWMTAPLAWLYAIPFDRFMGPLAAVQANLWVLALVAAWRVLLITRVLSVIYGMRVVPTFFIVMLLADIIVFAAVAMMPKPLVDLMGGLHQTDREQLIGALTFNIMFLCIFTSPIWLVGSLVALALLKPKWAVAQRGPEREPIGALAILGVVSVVVWLPILLLTQPEQQRRHRAERLLLNTRVSEALAEMSAHEPGDYPPHWDPPPRLGYGENVPTADALRIAIEQDRPAEWVMELFVAKMERQLHRALTYGPFDGWPGVLESIDYRDDGWRVAQAHRADIEFILVNATLADVDRQSLEEIAARGREDYLDVERLAEDGEWMMYQAAMAGRLDTVKRCLELGVSTDALDEAMLSAAQWGSPEAVELLVEAGAEVSARGENGRTLLVYAVTSGVSDNVRLALSLLPPEALEWTRDDGATPLHLAAMGDPEIVRLLLEAGADPEARTNDGRIPRDFIPGGSTPDVVEVRRLFDETGEQLKTDN